MQEEQYVREGIVRRCEVFGLRSSRGEVFVAPWGVIVVPQN